MDRLYTVHTLASINLKILALSPQIKASLQS